MFQVEDILTAQTQRGSRRAGDIRRSATAFSYEYAARQDTLTEYRTQEHIMDIHQHAARARSASGVNVLLGCWLIASPWIFGYTFNASGFWNSIVAGALIAILAAGRFSSPRSSTASSWINLLLGLWTIASPWIYGYAANRAAMWNCIAVGIVVAALASWSGRETAIEQHGATMTPAH